MKAKYLGWVVAAALIGIVAATGFQTGTVKIGVVDTSKVFTESEFYKTQADGLQALGQSRRDMITFVDQYKTFTVEQASRYHELSLKPTPTSAEKTELDGIKKAVQVSDARLKELSQKANPTAAETTEINELSRRGQTTVDTAQRWVREAQDEFETQRQKLIKDGGDKVREAVKLIAAAQSYTIVFTSDVAPYGANDLTAEALKAMNKK
jgi:Skp family chaperone for outer membrane proteins